jgi:hypothetical protein
MHRRHREVRHQRFYPAMNGRPGQAFCSREESIQRRDESGDNFLGKKRFLLFDLAFPFNAKPDFVQRGALAFHTFSYHWARGDQVPRSERNGGPEAFHPSGHQLERKAVKSAGHHNLTSCWPAWLFPEFHLGHRLAGRMWPAGTDPV